MIWSEGSGALNNNRLKKCKKFHIATEQELKKLKKLITIDRLRIKEAADSMGWTYHMVSHRCDANGWTNGRHGGQFEIDPKELQFIKFMLDKGHTYSEICLAINKKFNKNYTRSTIAHRIRLRGWKSSSNITGNNFKWQLEEIKVLHDLYPLNSPAIAYIRRLPGRSWGSIRKKLLELITEGKITLPKIRNVYIEKLQKVVAGGK